MKAAHRNNAISWAKKVLQNKNGYLILDSETTGLGKKDVIIQLAIINIEGEILFNDLIRPSKKKRISSDSTSIHGIKMADLKLASTFGEIVEKIYNISKNKSVIIFNEEFDTRLIEQTCIEDDVRILQLNTTCAMKYYSEFKGEWSEYHSDYKLQKLIGGDHTALGDCKAVLKLITKMANTEYEKDRFGKVVSPEENVYKTSWLHDFLFTLISNPIGCVLFLFLIGFIFITIFVLI